MICLKCGKELDDTWAVCPYCGKELKVNDKNSDMIMEDTSKYTRNYCPNCGEKLPEGSDYCTKCGQKVISNEEYADMQKNVQESRQNMETNINQIPVKNIGQSQSVYSEKKIDNKKLICAVGAIIIFIVLCICLAISKEAEQDSYTDESGNNNGAESISTNNSNNNSIKQQDNNLKLDEVQEEDDGNAGQHLERDTEVEQVYDETEYIQYVNGFIDLISASSELTDSTGTYKADALIDEDRNTCWSEGVSNIGEGEYIEVSFSSPILLTEIDVLNGYMKNENVYNANGKIRKIGIELSDGSSFECELQNLNYEEAENLSYSDYICFETPAWTQYLKITILEAEPGDKYDDTCLSEIAVFGVVGR